MVMYLEWLSFTRWSWAILVHAFPHLHRAEDSCRKEKPPQADKGPAADHIVEMRVKGKHVEMKVAQVGEMQQQQHVDGQVRDVVRDVYQDRRVHFLPCAHEW